MKIFILNSFSHSYAGLASLTVPNHIDYCRKYGYEYMTRMFPLDEVGNGMYANIDFRQLLFLLPFYDAIMTVGADVLFMNFEKIIERVIVDGAEQQIADEHIGGSHLNNDVMIWLNKKSTFDLIEYILSTREFVEFVHPFNWQMQMNNLVEDKHPIVSKLAVVDERVMNTYPEHYVDGDFIVHFYNMNLEQKIEGVKKFLPMVKL